MRDDKRNYIVVGAFVIMMLVALILWIAKLSGSTGATSTRWLIRCGHARAISKAMPPPIEYPTTGVDGAPAASSTASMSPAWWLQW